MMVMGGLSGDAACELHGLAAAGELAGQPLYKAPAGVLMAKLCHAGQKEDERSHLVVLIC